MSLKQVLAYVTAAMNNDSFTGLVLFSPSKLIRQKKEENKTQLVKRSLQWSISYFRLHLQTNPNEHFVQQDPARGTQRGGMEESTRAKALILIKVLFLFGFFLFISQVIWGKMKS